MADTLRTDEIEVAEGFNPRGKVARDDEFDGLVGSVREQGILQPILVAPPANGGKHTVVAGHRRLEAARAAGLEQVPVTVLDLEGAARREVAIVENIQRADLPPSAEADAVAALDRDYKRKDVARRIGRTEAWVRDRVRLAELPEEVKAAVDLEVVPLAAVPVLHGIAKVSPGVAAAAARVAARDQLDWANPGRMMESVHWGVEPDDLPEGTTLLRASRSANAWNVGFTLSDLEEAGVPVGDDLRRAEAEIPDHPRAYENAQGKVLAFNRADVDAAKAYGCLIEPGRAAHETVAYVTDPAWVLDRVPDLLKRLRRRREKAIEESPGGGPTIEKAETPEEAKEARRTRAADRQAEIEERAACHRRNLELGQLMRRELQTVKVTAEVADLVCRMAGERSEGWRWRWAYTDPELHAEDWRTTKAQEAAGLTGTVKVEVRDAESRTELDARWERAKAPGRKVGLLLSLLIAARFVDDRVSVAAGRRMISGPVTPIVRDGVYRPWNRWEGELNAAVDAIALELKVLPEDLRELAGKSGEEGAA